MDINYLDGSARQRQLFEETLSRSDFPWERLDVKVNVTWVEEIRDGDAKFVTFARTTLDADGTVTMRIDKDLESGAGFPAQFQGDEFVRETIHHELGHVASYKLTADQHEFLAHLLDAPAWTVEDAGGWDEAGQESFAETFKDVFLQKPNRKFDNRTKHRLPRDNFEEFLEVLRSICPHETGGGAS